MATTLNAGTTTATALNVITDTTGAMAIQTSGTTAIAISSAQVVSLTNPLAAGSGGTGVSSLGTGVATALGQNVTGSGSIVLAASPTLTGVPVAPTANVTTNTTQIATTAFVQAAIPSGVIVMWSGSVASIPSGWLLCNGSSSTPDLRDRFVVGAGSTYAVAATGGSANAVVVSHTHTATSVVTDPSHTHGPASIVSRSAGTAFGGYNVNLQMSDTTIVGATTGITVATTNASTGVSATNANLPPYYALAYIMKA
jgi:hypothetical protein